MVEDGLSLPLELALLREADSFARLLRHQRQGRRRQCISSEAPSRNGKANDASCYAGLVIRRYRMQAICSHGAASGRGSRCLS